MSVRVPALWLSEPRPEARLRLLCFPYAGAGANVFRGWQEALGADVEVAAVQLPGREWRRKEPSLTRMDHLVAALLPEVREWLQDPRPGIFFGYSMGAALCYAIAQELQHRGEALPRALFVAACRAPQLLGQIRRIFDLTDGEFVDVIRRFGGMPDSILSEPELLQLALPAIRADFEVLNTYEWRGAEPLHCPVVAYGATADQLATRAELAQWSERTRGPFRLRIFSGGHFFIHSSRPQLLRTLAADMAQVRAAAG